MATGDKLVTLDGLKAVHDYTQGQVGDLKSALDYVRVGDHAFDSSEMEQGSYDRYGETTSITTRMRVKGFVEVKKGEKLSFKAGSVVKQILVGYFDTSKTYISDSPWYNVDKDITFSSDGYIIIVYAKLGGTSTIVPSDYDATTTLLSIEKQEIENLKNDYPFLNPNLYTSPKAFLDFEIHLPDPSVSVKLNRVLRNSGNTYAVVMSIGGTTYNILNVLASNYTEKAYNEFSVSDVYGYFVIDWSVLTSGTNYNNINAELNNECKKPYIETPKYKNIEIVLPSVINTVIEKEISLEFYNIVNCSNIDEFVVEVSPSNSVFQNLYDRLRIVPSEEGSTSVTINIYKNSVRITSKTITVKTVADTQPSIKAMFLGDSMTNSGYYLAELKRMLGTKLTLYGTRSTTAKDSEGNDVTVLHEGRPGWSTGNYVSDSTHSSIANPFYNNGFNFSYYMTNNPSFNDVTDVFILLGTNDGAGTNFATNYATICNSIKNYNSSIRIHAMLPIPPIKSGYGFGTRSYSNYMTFKHYMINSDKKLISAYDGKTGYCIVPVMANLNCYYDFPQTEVTVNNRNPQLVPVGNDNVHPSKYGYYRFADVIYADIIANCQ